jgi:hypothetical protein
MGTRSRTCIATSDGPAPVQHLEDVVNHEAPDMTLKTNAHRDDSKPFVSTQLAPLLLHCFSVRLLTGKRKDRDVLFSLHSAAQNTKGFT